MSINTIKIDDVTYVRADAVNPAYNSENYKIVRSARAGVFAGYVDKQDGQTVVLKNARRIFYWDGAASLSQLAIDGPQLPDKCKFPCAVDVTLFEVIEILEVTETAKNAIELVKIWRK